MPTSSPASLTFEGVKVVVLDIEGTVCPISFVKEVLFPHALADLPSVLQTQWDAPTFAPYKDAFPPPDRATPEAFAHRIHELVTRDAKTPALKSLQGYLWRAGYESGALKCPLFPDVAPALRRWVCGAGLRVVIYSSGSVAAQRLLFQYTDVPGPGGPEEAAPGDLRPWIAGYFDTVSAGPKTERASYERIVGELSEGRTGAEAFLFLSDAVGEVRAAREAGMKAVVVVREGNAALSEKDRRANAIITSFAELELDKDS